MSERPDGCSFISLAFNIMLLPSCFSMGVLGQWEPGVHKTPRFAQSYQHNFLNSTEIAQKEAMDDCPNFHR